MVEKIIRGIDLFDFMSFLSWTFFNFLAHCVFFNKKRLQLFYISIIFISLTIFTGWFKIVTSEDSEKNVKTAQLLLQGTYLHEQSPYYQRVAKISDQIFAHNKDIPEIVNKKWPIFVGQFKMANDPEQGWDAVATANGEIYVNSDVLVKTKNDDQLAFILAHEISHICLNHNAEETEIDRNGISLSALTSMMLLGRKHL